MLLFNISWGNLWRNKGRTIRLIVLITITVVALVLFGGYMKYISNGLEDGYIDNTGNLQIAYSGYWDDVQDNSLIDSSDLEKIIHLLESEVDIDYIECALVFSGIVGFGNISSVFVGTAYDYPNKRYGIEAGAEIKNGDMSVILGKQLYEKLGLSMESTQTLPYVNLMSSNAETGVAFGSFDVVGVYSSGESSTDSMYLIASRDAVLDYFGLNDGASYIRINLKDDNQKEEIKKHLEEELSSKYEIRTWEELNPMYNQINQMYSGIYYMAMIVLCLLVIISISQNLGNSFYERLNEFGTLEAIGMRKIILIGMLLLEILLLFVVGMISGLITSFIIKFLVESSGIKFVPPGHTEGYPVVFNISVSDIGSMCSVIVFSCFIASIRPILFVLKNSIRKTMYHRS